MSIAAGVPRGLVVQRVAVAQEVPGRVDERVHRVRLALRRPAARRAGDVDPVLGRRQRRAALGLVVLNVGQRHRQLVLGDRHEAVALAVDDRDRAAPVALAGDQPVAQAVVDRRVPAPLVLEPRDDPRQRLAVAEAVEVGVRVHQRPVAGVGQLVAALHDPLDRQPVRLGEREVALVVRRHRHEGAGAVLHEHVVGDVDGQLAAVDRVGHGPPRKTPVFGRAASPRSSRSSATTPLM